MGQTMIGMVALAVILALWDSNMKFYHVYWSGMARVHADKELVCIERAAHYKELGHIERAAQLQPSTFISSQFSMWNGSVNRHRYLKKRYENLSNPPWLPTPPELRTRP
jgi:hypothetical protein